MLVIMWRSLGEDTCRLQWKKGFVVSRGVDFVSGLSLFVFGVDVFSKVVMDAIESRLYERETSPQYNSQVVLTVRLSGPY